MNFNRYIFLMLLVVVSLFLPGSLYAEGKGAAVMISPANRTNFSGVSAVFEWTKGSDVTEYNLQVGTAGNPTAYENYTTDSNCTKQVGNLSTDGSTVYVKLRSKIAGQWQENNYTYTSMKKAPAGAHSYMTAGGKIMVYHKPSDGYKYFDCPNKEVAYTMQIVKESDSKYYTIYHKEPFKSGPNCGDSFGVATHNGPFDYVIPSSRPYAIKCTTTDQYSRIWSSDAPEDRNKAWRNWGGAGNPMTVKGPNDSFYYIYFIACSDSDGDRWDTVNGVNEHDFSHYMCIARTKDFKTYEIRTELPAPDGICWKPYGQKVEWDRPKALGDITGSMMTSLRKDYLAHETQGMLGSICYYDSKYYLFYVDQDANNDWYLCYRWSPKIDELTPTTSWSPAIKISNRKIAFGQLVKIAPAHDMDRWVVIYHGLRNDGSKHGDIFVQYTENMNIQGAGGISDIVIKSSDGYYLGRTVGRFPKSGNTGAACYQHYFMTDPAGRLAVPDDKPQNATSGGLVTFSDHWTQGGIGMDCWGGDIYLVGWNLYVPQATLPVPCDGAKSISKTAKLSWDAGYKATYYKVYFGTTPNPPYVGEQVETTYKPANLTSGKKYWRVDAVNGDDGSLTAGRVWSFITQ